MRYLSHRRFGYQDDFYIFFTLMNVLYFKIQLLLGIMTFAAAAKLSTAFYDNRPSFIFLLEVTIFSEAMIPYKAEDVMGYLNHNHNSNYQT